MRTLGAVLIALLFLPLATSDPHQVRVPTVAADTLTFGVVRVASEFPTLTDLNESPDSLVVQRPVDAREGALSSVLVLDRDGVFLRRVAVVYGRSSADLIQIVSGVSVGDRLVVSNTRGWDAFPVLRLRLR